MNESNPIDIRIDLSLFLSSVVVVERDLYVYCGFGSQSCPIARCSLEHGKLEYCSECEEYPLIDIRIVTNGIPL